MWGYCHTRQALRTFRLDRIQELTVLPQTFQLPADFNARVFMEEAHPRPATGQARLKSPRNSPRQPR